MLAEIFKESIVRGNMKVYKKKTWQHEITGLDGNTILFGVNIFAYEWIWTGERADVPDPLYGQKYDIQKY